MSIVKSKHAGNFTILPNEIFKQGLSLQAIGLLSYLLSLPHDWVIQKTSLHIQLNSGRDRVDTAFKELTDKGYILVVKGVDKSKQFTYNYIVYDVPFNGEPEPYAIKPSTASRGTESPQRENPQLLSTNKKQSTNNKELSTKEFDAFWDLYDKKVGDKDKLIAKFSKLSQTDIDKLMAYIPKYKLAQPDKKYRKDPSTFLNNKSWNDEIIGNPIQTEMDLKAKHDRLMKLHL